MAIATIMTKMTRSNRAASMNKYDFFMLCGYQLYFYSWYRDIGIKGGIKA